MNIETLKIDVIISNEDTYDSSQICQCCGSKVEPKQQANGLDYYYTVNDRVISPAHLGTWLNRIGNHIANDPHPLWLHAAIQKVG